MAVARIVLITVPVETSPVTTHFQIQYNTDGGATWTAYNPGAGADISVSTLSSGVYTLDGINSPTGNTAAASYAGNWYQLRLKSSGGYGNWSDAFKIEDEPDDDGPLADISDVWEEFAVLADQTGVSNGWAYTSEEIRDRIISRLLTDAMDEMRADSSVDTLYTGTRTSAQGRALAQIERLLAVSKALNRPMTMKALGIHEPVLMEDSDSLRELSTYFRDQAYDLLSRLLSGTSTRPFAMPSVGSSTYTRTSSDRSPSERISLIDERDDIAADDLDNG